MTHGLATHRNTSAFLTGMHGRPDGYPAQAPTAPVAQVVHMRPALTAPVRDGAVRVGAMSSMDSGNRVCIARAAVAAGWAAGASIVVTCQGGKVVARPGVRTAPTDHASRYQDGRLTLPATVRARLELIAGDQVIVTSVPGTDSVLIVAAAEALQLLTGPVEVPELVAPVEPEELAVPVRRSSRVRAAWSEDRAAVR